VSDTLAVAPIAVVLVTILATLLVRSRSRLQRFASVVGSIAYLGTVGAITWTVLTQGDALVYQVGGWEAPVGITIVADELAAFVLGIIAIVGVYAAVVSVRFIDPVTQEVYYHPLYHILLLGATGAVLTGDLFNLFVWFEVMLMSSYVFVAFYGDEEHTAAALRYVVLNTIGGVCMLLGIGGLYATTGTLNMAELARILAAGGAATAPVAGFSMLLLATFALKAGIAPFQFWVPGAYRAAPIPVTALLAGATKKVGIYAIVRLYFTVLGGATLDASLPAVPVESPLGTVAPALLVMGLTSVLIGAVGAIRRDRLDGMFAYSSIGQIGFIAVVLAVGAATTGDQVRRLAVLAALVYSLHHALTKGLLFLSTAAIRDLAGTTQLSRLGGIATHSPAFASLFLVGALSLIGIPPLTGFFGKLFVVDTAATNVTRALARDSISAIPVVTLLVLLGGSVLTIVYVTRAWMGSCWGTRTVAVETGTFDGPLVAVLATLAGLVILVGVGFEPIYQFADAATEAAIDTDTYIERVGPADVEELGTGTHGNGGEHS